jgi:hypothetical protein
LSRFRKFSRLAAANLAAFLLLSGLILAGFETWCRAVDATDFYALSLRCRRWYAKHFRFNNAGVRDDVDYAPRLKPGVRRVSVLGDSLTAGTGLERISDRFVHRLRRPGREVHGLANVGWDTGDEVLYLEDMVRQGYETDVVVVAYFPNDLDDLLPAAPPDPGPPAWAKGAVETSFAVNALYYGWKARTDPCLRGYPDAVRAAYGGPAWEVQKSRLRRLFAFCRSRGSAVGVVVFPFLGRRAPLEGFDGVHAELAAFLAGEKVPVLDLLPPLRAASGRVLTVNRRDAHPNAFVHALAAEKMDPFLETLLKRSAS